MQELVRLLARHIRPHPKSEAACTFALPYETCLPYARSLARLKRGMEIQVGDRMFVLAHHEHDNDDRRVRFAFMPTQTWPIAETGAGSGERLIAYRPSPIGAGVSQRLEGPRGLLRPVVRRRDEAAPRRRLRFWSDSWAAARRDWKATGG